MRFLEPFELGFEKVQPFDVGNDRGLSRLMGCFEVGGGKRAAETMIGHHFIRPGEALEMVPIELTRFWCAQRGENPSRIPAEYRAVRHVGQARHRKRS